MIKIYINKQDLYNFKNGAWVDFYGIAKGYPSRIEVYISIHKVDFNLEGDGVKLL